MTASRTGGPAFPVTAEQSENGVFASSGMTLRDYFAAAALTGLMADPEDGELVPGLNCPQSVAYYAYEVADAMIHRRQQPPTPVPQDPADAGRGLHA